MSSLRTLVVAFAIASGLGFGLGLGLHAQAEPGRPVASAPRPESDVRLEARLLRLERAVDAVRQTQAIQNNGTVTVAEGPTEPAARHASDSPARPAPDTEGFASPEDETDSEQVRMEDTLYALEETLRDEPFDGAWATGQESFMADHFGNGAVGVARLVDVRCQSTLCRVEVAHESEEDQMMFPMLGLADPGFSGREVLSRSIESPQGGWRTELYLSREGYALPGEGGAG